MPFLSILGFWCNAVVACGGGCSNLRVRILAARTCGAACIIQRAHAGSMATGTRACFSQAQRAKPHILACRSAPLMRLRLFRRMAPVVHAVSGPSYSVRPVKLPRQSKSSMRASFRVALSRSGRISTADIADQGRGENRQVVSSSPASCVVRCALSVPMKVLRR